MAYKTFPIFSKIPNMAQYDLADWSQIIKHAHSGDLQNLEAAQSEARQNENASFFFYMRDGMYLRKNGYFASGDNVFFSGIPWLGSAPMSDTYFVAEAYDTNDEQTRQWLKTKIDSIKIGQSAASVTLNTPLTGGFIFIDFVDEQGKKPINESFERLISYTEADGKTKKTAADWLQAESKTSQNDKPRFNITFELHSKNATGSYIRMKNSWSTYKDNLEQIQTDLKSDNISIPPEWDIIYVVLPEGASKKNLFTSQEQDCNWSGRNNLEIIYLDSSVFDETNDRDWAVVAHETLHALGLPDLYFNNRSFGWSMMSDCRVAWHLLGWEKLLLGWVDVDDYLWLKRGLVDKQIYGMFANKGNNKGIVLLDDTNNFAYVIEMAQPKGRKISDRDTWNQNALLLYRVEFRNRSGQIVPLVHEWSTDDNAGGAPLAPYPAPPIAAATQHLHNNVFLQLMEKGSNAQNTWIRAYVAQLADWKPSESADGLVCDEFIQSKSGKYRLTLTVDGQLEFQIKKDSSYIPIWGAVADNQLDKGYGFFCEVGRDGNVVIYQGTGPNNKGEQLWSMGKSLAQNHYFLWLVETPTGCHVSVYAGHDHTNYDLKQYDLFDYPDQVDFDVKELIKGKFVYSRNLDYRLQLGSDGNLTLSNIKTGSAQFSWSAFTQSTQLPKGTPSASFDADGRFQIKDNNQPIKSWPELGTNVNFDSQKPKNFFLSVADNGAIVVYQGKGLDDSNKKKLYDIR